MGKAVLKWLAALGTGALSAAALYIQSHSGTGPGGIDPAIAGIVVAALAKIVSWLTSKIPATPAA